MNNQEIKFPLVSTEYVDYYDPTELEAGIPVGLEHEPNNTKDRDAIAVLVDNNKVGYIPNRGVNCSKCHHSVLVSDYSCANCGELDSYLGGLASRLLRTGFLKKDYMAYIYDIRGDKVMIKIELMDEGL